MAQPEAAEATHGGTIDDAVEALDGMDWSTGEITVEEAPEDAPVEASEDDEEESEVELEAEEEELAEEEPQVEAIDAPVSWSDEQKEVFTTLPPDAQQVIVDRESDRDKGFQQKSTELATERKQIADERQQMNFERQQYAQTLSDKLSEGLEEPNIDLLMTNPEQYRQEKIAFDQNTMLRNQAKDQADYYAGEAQKQDKLQKEQFYASRNKELLTELPAFMSDAQYRDGVLTYGKGLGYSDGDLEMARTQDIVTIDKAMKWDALQSSKPGTKDKLKVVPKVVKPGAKQTGNPKTRAAKANLKAHHKKGDVHSAAKAMDGWFD